MPLLNQQIKECNISKFVIYSADEKSSCSVSGGFVNLQYVESISSNYIRLSATFADTGFSVEKDGELVGVTEGLSLSSSEFVELTMIDGLGNKFEFSLSDGTALRIEGIRERQSTSTESMVFTLDLVTTDYYHNKLDTYTFDGIISQKKVSEAVKEILNNYLKTERDLDIEETSNSRDRITGSFDNPFHKCTVLARQSIPTTPGANSKTAGYFFFETYDGYNFKSIERLLDSKNREYKKYVYNSTTYSIENFDGKILDAKPSTDIHLGKQMKMGALGTIVQTTNSYDNIYRETRVSADSDDAYNLAGSERPKLTADFYDTTGKPIPSKRLPMFQSIGATKKVTKDKSKEEDYSVKDIEAQSTMRYNQLFTSKLQIIIAGDLSHRAGDLVYCYLPKLSSSKSRSDSDRYSGIYMIADLSHYMSTDEGLYTKMNLVRDSFGKTPFKIT